MDELPTHFTVVFKNRKPPSMYSIHLLHTLPSFIHQWGFESIRKIIFSFEVTDWTQYPYGVHNLVLQRSPKGLHYFEVQFYHYCDVRNHLITIPQEQQISDFYTILRLIYQHDDLADTIGKGVIDPFFKTNESGLLC